MWVKECKVLNQTYFSVGVSPLVGFDYTTQRTVVPFIFALDYKPTLLGDFPLKNNQKPNFDFSYYELAFSVKVGIGKTGKYLKDANYKPLMRERKLSFKSSPQLFRSTF